MIQQRVDLTAPNIQELTVTDLRIDVFVQNAFGFALGAELVSIDVTRNPVLGNFLETVGERLRGELSGIVVVVARLLPRVLEAELRVATELLRFGFAVSIS